MRVLVWPADHSGVGHYRLIFPAQALASGGVDVAVDWTGPRVLWDGEWDGEHAPLERNVLGLAEAPEADVVVLQRPTRKHWAQTIPHLQRAGVRVVVDVDDDYSAIHRDNVVAHIHDPWRNPNSNAEWLALACRRADLVTVSTAALSAKYGGTVLPNYVPGRYLDIPRPAHEGVVVGWSGTIYTHPDDLEVTKGALVGALPGARFHVVGTGQGVKDALKLYDEPTTTGWVPFEQYPVELAALDIGVVPLLDSTFNTAKSCLKMLEMAATGSVPVGSPTPDNRRLARMGVGVIAHTPKDWSRAVRRLIQSQAEREWHVGHAREVILDHLTYEMNLGRWQEAWGSVLRKVPA